MIQVVLHGPLVLKDLYISSILSFGNKRGACYSEGTFAPAYEMKMKWCGFGSLVIMLHNHGIYM